MGSCHHHADCPEGVGAVRTSCHHHGMASRAAAKGASATFPFCPVSFWKVLHHESGVCPRQRANLRMFWIALRAGSPPATAPSLSSSAAVSSVSFTSSRCRVKSSAGAPESEVSHRPWSWPHLLRCNEVCLWLVLDSRPPQPACHQSRARLP